MTSNRDTAAPLRLSNTFDSALSDTVTDQLMIAAKDVEDAMMQSGAVPGKDSTGLDRYKLAVQIHGAVTRFNGVRS